MSRNHVDGGLSIWNSPVDEVVGVKSGYAENRAIGRRPNEQDSLPWLKIQSRPNLVGGHGGYIGENVRVKLRIVIDGDDGMS